MDNLIPTRTKSRVVPRERGAGTWTSYSGSIQSFTNTTGNSVNNSEESLLSKDTLFPLVNHYYRKLYLGRSGKARDKNWVNFKKNMDMGSGSFRVDRFQRVSNYPFASVYRDQGLSGKTSYIGPINFQKDTTALKSFLLQGIAWPTDEQLQEMLIGLGTTAIARSNPMKSQNQILVSITELLREGLPKMVGLSLIRDPVHKKSSSEFLNYEFGIAPLISDINSLMETVIKVDDLLLQYVNRSNKELRRKYYFPRESSNDRIQDTTRSSVSPSRANVYEKTVSGYLIADRRYSQRTWFSGAFRYCTPNGDSLLDFLELSRQKAAYILGIRLTPDTVWNLLPWSWLADWFTNIGDVLSNISYIGSDGLVLRYGYIMRHTRIEATLSHTSEPTPFGGAPLSETVLFERKARRRALPYGFSPLAANLNDKQWAILGAIGLTSSPRSLL